MTTHIKFNKRKKSLTGIFCFGPMSYQVFHCHLHNHKGHSKSEVQQPFA